MLRIMQRILPKSMQYIQKRLVLVLSLFLEPCISPSFPGIVSMSVLVVIPWSLSSLGIGFGKVRRYYCFFNIGANIYAIAKLGDHFLVVGLKVDKGIFVFRGIRVGINELHS